MRMPRVIQGWLEDAGFKKADVIKAEIMDAPKPKASAILKNIKIAILKFKEKLTGRNAQIAEVEYDLPTIRKAIDVESLIRQAKEKYLQLIWKNGYSFVGKDQNSSEYVKMRMKQIAIISNTPMNVILETISEELITYHNAYVVLQRDAVTGGKNYTNILGKSVNPIAAMFVLPASHVQPVIDTKSLKQVGWSVTDFRDDPDKFFNFEDVVHFYLTKVPGNKIGTPMLTPVLDDIRALRKMEENAEALVYQHAIPLFEYKVGSDEHPIDDPNEMDEVSARMRDMDPHGMIVLPYNHKITAIGAGANPIDVERYLQYFRKRIIAGLGLSDVAFGSGDTANRGTASVQDKGIQDGAKRYAGALKTFVNEFIIREILQEGGFDILDDLQKVELFIPEVDMDAKHAKETHYLALYQGNGITENELRAELGRDPFTDQDRVLTYMELVTIPKIKAQAEAAAARAAAGAGGSTGLDIPKVTATKVRPTNQAGVKKISTPTVNQKLEFLNSPLDQQVIFRVRDELNSLMGRIIKTLPQATKPMDWNNQFDEMVTRTKDGCASIIHQILGEELVERHAESTILRFLEQLQNLKKDGIILVDRLQTEKFEVLDAEKEVYANGITSTDIIAVFDTLHYRINHSLQTFLTNVRQTIETEMASRATKSQAEVPVNQEE